MGEPLTLYGDQELSLRVFNDENLYNQRHSKDFWETIKDLFTFTKEQADELRQDLQDDLNELS